MPVFIVHKGGLHPDFLTHAAPFCKSAQDEKYTVLLEPKIEYVTKMIDLLVSRRMTFTLEFSHEDKAEDSHL
jgi:hypothetical protein